MVEDNLLLLEISKLPKTLANNDVSEMPMANEEDRSSTSSDDGQLSELREARIRAAQMEKTVQWWSECTANWREKWATVKNERNKARDEMKVFKSKLDAANQEIYKLKKESNEFSEGNSKLQKDVERMEAELRRDRRAFVPPLRIFDASKSDADLIQVKTGLETEPLAKSEDNETDNTLKESLLKVSVEGKAHDKIQSTESVSNTKQISNESASGEKDSLLSKDNKLCDHCAELQGELTALKTKLKDAEKEISEEISSKENLSDTIDELTADIETLKGNIQEEKLAKEKATSELNRVKEERQKRRGSLPASKDGEDRKVKELRIEIEKLQKANAAEWNKREKLQTEKLAADRETKKLRHEVEDLERELKSKVEEERKAVSFEMKQLQTELDDNKKELTELKATHLKLKKVYQDKKDDVIHTKTRVDHHEDEIKKLRGRIDDLKQTLTTTQDEVDHKDSLARKLQRSLEEKIQECDVLQVQLGHLQSRWKKMTLTARIPRRGGGEVELSEEEKRLMELDFEDEFD